MSSFKSESDIASYLVGLPEAPLDTSAVAATDRPTHAFLTLSAWAQKTQASVRRTLDNLGVSYRAYWVTNVIAVESNASVALHLATMAEVLRLEPNKEFRVPLETPQLDSDVNATAPAVIEWNINWVQADLVWPQGQGEGHVVANADTGVAWQHPALISQYRGTSGGTANHNFNWWDAIHNGGTNRCGLNSQVPCDDNGHGTHTTGTAVGYHAATDSHIGVAPGAKWIACRNMNAGLGTAQRYIECLQFFIAPTDLSGNNPTPTLAPHSIGNSYGCPPSEGCAANALAAAVSNVVQAGIFMSVSAGNAGPGCGSVNDPPAIYEDSFSVGATNNRASTIASYSSRGPVTVDQSGRLKPNIVAPGSSVRSAYPPSTYATLSGTSMASPCVTGAIPLIWQARPALLRDVEGTAKLIEQTAAPVRVTTCGQAGAPDLPNNVYGYGELDVLTAALGNK